LIRRAHGVVDRKSILRIGSFGCLLAMLIGCGADMQHAELPQLDGQMNPVRIQQKNGRNSVVISVLIYNVAGLPWPLGCGKRSRQQDENGERIPIACDRTEARQAVGNGSQRGQLLLSRAAIRL